MEENNNLNNSVSNSENSINHSPETNNVSKSVESVNIMANSTNTNPIVSENNNNESFKKSTDSKKHNTFKAKKSSKTKTNYSFGKSVVLPFTCGILGAAVVVGSCFGIPSIRENLFSNYSVEEGSSSGTINTQQISLVDYSSTAVGVAQKVLPSIVGISVSYSVNSIFYGSQASAEAQGSGVIISEDGYILTNNHVINSSSSSSFYELGEATKIVVTLYNDDTEYEATIVGTDEQTDLAVIKIEKDGLTAAELGDSDSVQVGEFCMAIGNPLGLGITVTDGIISAVDREVTDSDGNTYTAIQTNAAINSGNSGGALVNSQGQVIGINTLKVSGEDVEGVGFAIPINSTKDITDQLIEYNKVKRPYLGIAGIDVTEDMAEKYNLVIGVYVQEIETFSAAERGGIKVGDIIIEADGTEVENMTDLNSIKNEHEIGDTMTLTVWRNGETETIEVTLQEEP